MADNDTGRKETDHTPNPNKRARPFSKRTGPSSDKRKRINSKPITAITPVNLDSSSEDEPDMAANRTKGTQSSVE